MLRLIAATAVLVLAGAGAARADDCGNEGTGGATRSPVFVQDGRGAFVGDTFYDPDSSGALDDGEAARFVLGGTARGLGRKALSPSPLRDGTVVEWQAGGIVTGDGRVLIAGVAFPGYRGVAAAEAPDGTITVLYGTPAGDGSFAMALRRIAPDGTAGAPVALPVVSQDPTPRLAVDDQGTAFAVARGDHAGVAAYWPGAGDPRLTPSAALAQPGWEDFPPAVVPDRSGGAWFRVAAGHAVSLLRIDAAGARLHTVATHVTASTDPVADGRLAYTKRGIAYYGRRRLGRGEVESLALDPRTGRASILETRGDALVLDGVTIRSRRGYSEADGSLAIGPDGRDWVVWEEISNRLDQECDEFPVHDDVRWAALAHGRGPSHALAGAPVITSW